jgi:hypothetical protein
MILYFIRALLILLLLFVIIVDFDLPIIISTKTNQLFIAIIVLLIIIVVDEIIGFLIGLIFLIIYFKYYQKKIMPTSKQDYQNIQSPISTLSYLSSSPFISTPSFISTASLSHFNGGSDTNNGNNDPITSFFNMFKGDVKPKSYSTQPEIPDHYIKEIKNENSTLIPYISNELLKSAQNNIYNDENYKIEIKTDDNYYGIQGLNSDNKHFAAFDNDFNYHNNL